MLREGLRQHIGETATGYGVSVGMSGAKLFEPFIPPDGVARKVPMLQNTRFPVSQRSDWPVKEGVHSITVQVQGDNASVEFDRQYRKNMVKIRPTGTFVLEVRGSADVQLPQARKL
jgi:hypothetical protein